MAGIVIIGKEIQSVAAFHFYILLSGLLSLQTILEVFPKGQVQLMLVDPCDLHRLWLFLARLGIKILLNYLLLMLLYSSESLD